MKAVIISEHEGNRLRPLTCSVPKSMLPVLGRPVTEYTLRLLRRHNICDVTFISGYLSEEIKKHYGQSGVDGMCISFAEKKDLRAMAAADDLLIISGSLLTDINLEDFISFHREKNSKLTVCARSHIPFSDYGAISVGSDFAAQFRDSSYIDEQSCSNTFFMGIMLMSKGTAPEDFSHIWDVPRRLSQKGTTVYAYLSNDYIRDVCDIDAYLKCSRDFLDKKINLPFPCDEKEPGVWISPGAKICQGAVIVPPVFIGSGSKISRGVRVEAYSVIGENVYIGEGASIKRSIIMDNASIGSGCSLRGAIVAEKAETGFESAAYESSIVGCGSKLGRHCTLRPSVRIWPYKDICDDSCISSNIVWESLHSHHLFSDGVAAGRINSEITPEFAVRLGCAAANRLGDKIAVSSDGSGYGTMIKNALIAGIQSAGAQPFDFGEQPLPITRSGIRFYSLSGGIALSVCKRDGELFAELDIINGSGADIENADLTAIEQCEGFGNLKRAEPGFVPEPEYLFEYKLYYLKRLINSTTKKELGIKLLINAPSPWAKNLLESASADLKCEFIFTDSAEIGDFCEKMKQAEYDFGALLDHKCEKLTLVTREGRILSEFDYEALTALIIMKSYPGAVLYTPVSSPDSIELMAKKYGATVHRTKLSPPKLMNELSSREEKMFMHQFIYRFDAVGALIKLTDFLCASSVTLSTLLRELPESHMVSAEVSCPAEEQDKTLEKLNNHFGKQPVDDTDGLKFSFDNGWVLVIPRKYNSAIRIISHGFTEEYARELSDICIDSITNDWR